MWPGLGLPASGVIISCTGVAGGIGLCLVLGLGHTIVMLHLHLTGPRLICVVLPHPVYEVRAQSVHFSHKNCITDIDAVGG